MHFKFPIRGNDSNFGCNKCSSIKNNCISTSTRKKLVVIQVNSELKPEQSGQVYEVQPNEVLSDKYPNIYVVPMIHNVDTCIPDTVPMVIINFVNNDVSISKGENNGVSYKVNP